MGLERQKRAFRGIDVEKHNRSSLVPDVEICDFHNIILLRLVFIRFPFH